MPRMRILSTVEQEAFESPPEFTSVQRKQYFDFPRTLRQIACRLRTSCHQLGFLLSCGYFRATKRFFAPRKFHTVDLEYIARKLAISTNALDAINYSERTRQRHQHLILEYYGYRAFDIEAQSLIRSEIEAMACSQLKPRLIFGCCIDLLIREKVQIPSYLRLAKPTLNAVNQRKKVLAKLIEQGLSDDTKELLDALFVQSKAIDGDTVGAKTAAYKLTLLKKLSQSTKPSKVKERVADLELLAGLYKRLQPVLQTISLSHEGIQYYANSVIKSEIFQVARRTDEDRYLHVIAFIAHQYHRLQDNLIDGLLITLQSFKNSVQREHKELCYTQHEQHNQSIEILLNGLQLYRRTPTSVSLDGN